MDHEAFESKTSGPIHMQRRIIIWGIIWGSLSLVASWGCTVQRWSFSPEYLPLTDERDYLNNSHALPYAEVDAAPERFRKNVLSWFGVVRAITPDVDGYFLITLDLRRHLEPHKCATAASDSCRVTVGTASQGIFVARLALDGQHLQPGEHQIEPGDLVRIYGKLICEPGYGDVVTCRRSDSGQLVIEAGYYRHWPRRYYWEQ